MVDELTPELKAEIADAAEFLLPLAHAHVANGQWPIEVKAWLIMLRDTLGDNAHNSAH